MIGTIYGTKVYRRIQRLVRQFSFIWVRKRLQRGGHRGMAGAEIRGYCWNLSCTGEHWKGVFGTWREPRKGKGRKRENSLFPTAAFQFPCFYTFLLFFLSPSPPPHFASAVFGIFAFYVICVRFGHFRICLSFFFSQSASLSDQWQNSFFASSISNNSWYWHW